MLELLLLLVLSITSWCPAAASEDISIALTNAQRFQRGLSPLPPASLRQSLQGRSRRNEAHARRQTVVSSLPPLIKTTYYNFDSLVRQGSGETGRLPGSVRGIAFRAGFYTSIDDLRTTIRSAPNAQVIGNSFGTASYEPDSGISGTLIRMTSLYCATWSDFPGQIRLVGSLNGRDVASVTLNCRYNGGPAFNSFPNFPFVDRLYFAIPPAAPFIVANVDNLVFESRIPRS